MKAKITYNLDDPEQHRLLMCAIRSNELAIACWELNNNVFRYFDDFVDINEVGEDLAERLDALKVRIYEMIPNNLDELVS